MDTGRRWVVLLAGLVAVSVGCTVQYGLPFLIPGLRDAGLSLTEAGVIAGCPIAGLLATLFAWGAAADRWGERGVLTAGLALGGLTLLAGSRATGVGGLAVCFLLAGAATAAVHAASGRLVLGWFAAHERGFAMAVRQTAQPVGVGIAALSLPPLTGSGLGTVLAFLGGLCISAAVLVLVVVRDPPRAAATAAVAGSPYRTHALWRIHGASALLVVPQFVVATYALAYLVDERGWTTTPAGRLLAAAAIGGAAARLAAGFWSDRVGSRLRPMRALAVLIGTVLLGLAAAALTGSAVATAALVGAAVMSVSTNGLAFTAVAEQAGRAWAGRALGVQNTAQNAIAALTPPAFAVVIASAGYAVAFAVAVGFALAASAVIPITSERAGTVASSDGA